MNNKKIKLILSRLFPSVIKNIYLMVKYRCFIDFGTKIYFIKNLKIGQGTIIRSGKIYAQEKLEIGKNCLLEDDITLNTKGGQIIIGNNVAINQQTIIYGTGGVVIEDEVRIAPGVKILKNHLIPPLNDNGNYIHLNSKPTKIGKWSFIGANTIILDGVNIGKYSIVGANSLVNKDIPKGVIAFGTPAKVVRVRKNE